MTGHQPKSILKEHPPHPPGEALGYKIKNPLDASFKRQTKWEAKPNNNQWLGPKSAWESSVPTKNRSIYI